MASSQSSEHDDPPLETRVERLERVVENLRAEVRRLRSVVADEDAPSEAQRPKGEHDEEGESVLAEGDGGEEALPEESPPPSEPDDDALGETPPEGPPRPDRAADHSPARGGGKEDGSAPPSSASDPLLDRLVSWAGLSSEDWLNYVGIGLLLFGLAFLFQYSVEQGWLVPTVRVGFGVVLGSVLLVAGLRIYTTRRRLRRVLLGGSSATFYATVFAAYQLYGLIAYPVAFASMILVTVVTIALAIRQDASSLAVIGTVGGLGTPFLLYGPVESVSGLTVYICTILVGACAIFLVRGWRSLLYTTVAGGWLVFLVSTFQAGVLGARPPDAWALQVGIGVAWALLAGAPVLRVLLRRGEWDRGLTVVRPSWVDRWVGADRPAYGLVMASPFLALISSRLLWDASGEVWAAVAGVGAVVYAGAYVRLRRASLPRYAPVHGLVAAVLAAYGLSKILGGSALLVAWGVEAGLLLALARRLGAPELRRAGHALFALLTVGLVDRLAGVDPDTVSILQPSALSELVVLGLVAGGSALVRHRWLRWTYRGVALAGWLAWWAGEFAAVPNGEAYTLVLWAATATTLAAAAVRLDDDRPVRIATHTLFAVLGGLFASELLHAEAADLPLVSVPALTELLVLALTLAASRYPRLPSVRTLYRGAVLAGWLAWGLSELAPVANGQAYVSAVWGATAAVLLVGGVWARRRRLQLGGLTTLALFVAKLFLVDLAALPALGRIALFLGSGAAFLGISYLLPGFVVGSPGPAEAKENRN